MSTESAFALESLHHIQLAIPLNGEDQCREFWGEILGMVEIEKPADLRARGGCWFRNDGIEIHLGVAADFIPAKKAHPGILVTRIHELAEHLERNGVSVTWDGNYPGFERFYANDPFGNRLEFLQKS